MIIKERSKAEVEKKLSSMGDYVRIDYLDRILRRDTPLEIKNFAYEKLSALYEDKGMFAESARNMNALADSSITFREKIQRYVKTAELFIKAGMDNEAEKAFSKALACGSSKEKEEIKGKLKEFYFNQAQFYERGRKSNRALAIYEKILRMKITDIEIKEVKKKMLPLYDKLGKIQEYFRVKKQLEENE